MGGVAVEHRRTGPTRAAAALSTSEIITLLLDTVQVSNISRASITASPSRCCAATFPACRATSTSSPCRKVPSCRWCSSSTVTWGPGPGYYINSTALPVCDNHRISRHKVFADLAQRGKTSMGWFFGFKLHLVFNNDNEIVALKLTPGNVHDTTPVPALTRDLIGKLFGDKGYIGQKLAEDLLRRGLTLFTRVRKNMKSLPLSLQDKALLNARNMAETHRPHQGVLVPQSVQASIRHQRLRSHHRGHHRLPDQPVQAQAQPSAPLSAQNHSLKTPYRG